MLVGASSGGTATRPPAVQQSEPSWWERLLGVFASSENSGGPHAIMGGANPTVSHTTRPPAPDTARQRSAQARANRAAQPPSPVAAPAGNPMSSLLAQLLNSGYTPDGGGATGMSMAQARSMANQQGGPILAAIREQLAGVRSRQAQDRSRQSRRGQQLVQGLNRDYASAITSQQQLGADMLGQYDKANTTVQGNYDQSIAASSADYGNNAGAQAAQALVQGLMESQAAQANEYFTSGKTTANSANTQLISGTKGNQVRDVADVRSNNADKLAAIDAAAAAQADALRLRMAEAQSEIARAATQIYQSSQQAGADPMDQARLALDADKFRADTLFRLLGLQQGQQGEQEPGTPLESALAAFQGNWQGGGEGGNAGLAALNALFTSSDPNTNPLTKDRYPNNLGYVQQYLGNNYPAVLQANPELMQAIALSLQRAYG